MNFRRKKPRNKVYATLGVIAFFVVTSLISSVYGSIADKAIARNKDVKTYLWHEAVGINDVETKNEESTKELSYGFEQIKQEKEALELENKKYMNLVSRGNTSREIIDFEKLPGPIYLLELTQRMCEKHGFKSMGEIYSIICYESRYDPACHNTRGEDSRGLLQVNVADKSHRKRNPNVTKLFDPAYNLDYQLDELYDYYILGQRKGLKGAELAKLISKYGQRPQWSQSIANQIDQSYKLFLNARIKEAR